MNLKRVEYPVLPFGDKPTEEEKEKLIEKYYGHKNQGGFFLLGVNNTWHGGIHIEDSSAIRAIADGRIIAYRIPEKYSSLENNKDIQFSNGFILIQHRILTPEKKALRFYSLYMHLEPKCELENNNGKTIPNLYAKFTIKHVLILPKEKGLRVRLYKPSEEKKGKETHFMPRGTIIDKSYGIEVPKNHWLNDQTQYVLCNWNNKTFCVYKGWLNAISDFKYQVNHYKANEDSLERFGKKGVMVFDENGKYVDMITKPVEIDKPIAKKKWYKIKDKKHYIVKDDCDGYIKAVKEDIELDTVNSVDVPIIAGEVIGIPSKFNIQKNKFYTASHVEVFTDDKNLKNFIENKEDEKISYLIDKGKPLELGKPCTFLKSSTKVKIYEIGTNYTQIGFEDVITEIEDKSTHLKWTKKLKVYVNGKVKERSTYIIKEPFFDEVNKSLHNRLPTKETQVYLQKQLEGNKRIIGYGTVYSGKKYWVKNSEVTGEKGKWVTLENNIDTIYSRELSDEKTSITLEKECKARKVDQVKDNNNVQWLQVTTKEGKGWIKKDEVTIKNAFLWKDFGWDIVEDTGNQYFYMFGEYVTKSEPHKFVKRIWDLVDTNKDQKLSNFELQEAVKNPDILEKIGKLICKHPSEWNMQKYKDQFKQELIDIHQKGIDEAKGTDKDGKDLKGKLIEQRDEKIKVLLEKVEKLSFWEKVKGGDIVSKEDRKKAYIAKHSKRSSKRDYRGVDGEPTEEEKKLTEEFELIDKKRIKRFFPVNDSKVYHFHPILFVEHIADYCAEI